jgi:hypothetical protein
MADRVDYLVSAQRPTWSRLQRSSHRCTGPNAIPSRSAARARESCVTNDFRRPLSRVYPRVRVGVFAWLARARSTFFRGRTWTWACMARSAYEVPSRRLRMQANVRCPEMAGEARVVPHAHESACGRWRRAGAGMRMSPGLRQSRSRAAIILGAQSSAVFGIQIRRARACVHSGLFSGASCFTCVLRHWFACLIRRARLSCTLPVLG